MAQRKQFQRLGVVLSIAVLATAVLAFLQYQGSVVSGKEATLKSELFVMRDALDSYAADTGTCPESLSQLVEGKYIRAVPRDPFTKSSTTWKFTQTRTDRGTACDVKSTSRDLARDGSRHADW